MSRASEERLKALLYDLSAVDMLRMYDSDSPRTQDDVNLESEQDLHWNAEGGEEQHKTIVDICDPFNIEA